jgi:hypothetical protein
MSWLFSQALVGEYLGAIFLDGEQCVQSSGSPIQQAYCAPDKMTECSRLSRSGMMFKPLTEDRGEELLMSYLAAFHAKTSPQPEKEQGLTESGQGCGEKWHGSFTKYDPDSCSWRTHQCLLLGDLELFSGTWPRWGLMRSGECWEQQTLAHHTSETESGFWPTPRAQEPARTSEGYGRGLKELIEGKQQIKRWPTPDANCGMRGTQENWLPTRLSGQPAQYTINQAVRDSDPLTTGGKLNPMWVEWLMGWPMGWTDLKPLETDKFQKWLDEHGSY